MKSDKLQWLQLGGLICLAIVLCFAADKLAGLDSKLATILLHETSTMQTITQEVTRADGSKVTISTVRLAGEAVGTWIKRHDEAIAALQA
jgi:hypothetical protein